MVVKAALQRWVAGLLRPWLQEEPSMEFDPGLFRCEGAFQDLKLNVAALNSAFMQSSKLLMHSATIGGVSIKILPWSRPVVTLRIYDVHIILRPRPLDDEFWERSTQWVTDEQETKNALCCIDPQGAVLHAASERVMRIQSSSNWFVTFLTNISLQCSRIVLCNTSIEVQIPEKDFPFPDIQDESGGGSTFYRCFLRAKHFSMEDGFFGHNKSPGGFLIAIISVLYSYRGAQGCKTCNVEDLGLELKKLAPLHFQSPEIDRKYVIFFKELKLSMKMKHLQLTDLEFGVPEVRLGLYPRDMNELMRMLQQINYNAEKSAASAKYRQLAEKAKYGKSSRNLWHRAVENITRLTPRYRLQKLVETVILRLRYAKAYESWLLELRWGLKRGCIDVGSTKVKSKCFASCAEGLWKDVCEKENELPVEAVAQVRRVVRQRVLAQLKEDHTEELADLRGQKYSLPSSVVLSVISFLLQCLRKLLQSIYTSLLYFFTALFNFINFLCPFFNKSFFPQPANENQTRENRIQNFHDTKQCGYLFNVSQLCYTINIYKVFIDSACNAFNEKQKGVAISSITGTYILFVLENLFLVYASDVNAMNFSVVCGDLNGQIFPAASIESDLDRSVHNRQGAYLSTNDSFRRIFLRSNPAPQIHCLNKSRNGRGNVNVSSLSNAVFEKHQGQMWSDWENKVLKPKMPVGIALSTPTGKPFLLSEVESFVIDPSLRNPNSGLLRCDLALGELFFDLDCSSLICLIFLLLQLVDSSEWKSFHGSKKSPHFLNCSANYTANRGEGWEELYDSYLGKMKQAMLSTVPEKNIHLTAAIAGPKIQLSTSSEEYLKFEKQTILAKNHTSFVLDLGNLEIAIWPAAQGEALSLLQEQETDTSKLEQIWLKKLPILDHSRDFKSDFHMGHGQVGSNIYLKLEDAVVLLQNISGNKLPLVKPLTVTVESSVCRDQINSVLTTEKVLLASLGCTSSAFALICSMDELLFVIQIFEGFVKGMLDAFHEFLGRDARPLQELCRDANIHHSKNEYTGNSTKRSSSQQFDEVISPQFTSFAVVLTVDLETMDLLLEGSRGNLGDQNLKEVESGSENGKQNKISDDKCKHNDILRKIDLPNIDLKVLLESCNVKFDWGDTKQAQFSLRLSGFQVHVSDNTIETYKNSGNEVQQFKTRPVKEVSGACTKIFTDLSFQSCTLKLYGGPHVYDKKFREENTRNRTGAGSSLKSQTVQESANSALPLECFNRHLDEFTLEFPQRRNIFEYNAVDLPFSSSSYWLVVDVDLSECLLTDCSLEMLISEAMKKLSGSKRLHALFTVGKDFESVSGKVQGGCLVVQMAPLAILLKSYRAYRLFLEHISSFFMPSIRKLKVRTSEVTGIAMISEESNSYTTLRQAQRSLSFSFGSSRQSTSKAARHMQRSLSLPVSSSQERSQPIMHGVNTKKPFIEMLSLTVQQFSLVLAHADVSDGAQGVLLEMDFKTIIEIGHQKNKLSIDLSRLMMLGLHPIRKVTRGKEKADHIPHFGSTSPKSISDDTQQAPNHQLPLEATTLSSRHVSKALNDHHLHDTLPGRVSSSSSYDYTGRDCNILKCMTASFNIECVSAGAELGSRKHMDAWQGGCSISGVDLVFTTSEILMLLVLTSSLSELSTGNVVSSPQMTNYDSKQTEGAYSEPRIPDGAIVAVKDAQEHLYLAVERIQNKYRLTGVLHYTLAGDKALFRVKYQGSRLWKNSQSWFSLLSVHARNDIGEPFCVHCRPGSALVDVSSTHDNAWELWCTIPFKHKAEDEEELDFHGNLYKKMVHLVNKKSGNGLAFVNGLPMLVRQPGNLLKLKMFVHDTLLKSIPPATPPLLNNASNEDGSLNMQPSYEKLAVMATILPQVNVVVEKLSITILYEASGFHFLPLLRVCMNDAHFVLQVSSSKLRIISTLRIMVECYEAQRNMWLEIVRPVEISVVYRALGATHERGVVAFEKMPISFYSMLKRVDLSVSEPALDILLFLSGELNLAGPYTIKHSPVTANCCKIENCTGLNLLCSFDDKVDVKIAARKAESFLIRRMVSRRSLHLESSKNMILQLVNSGTLSSIPVHISLEAPGVTVLRTNIMSRESQSRVSGSLIVVDVSKQNEDAFSVMVSPIVRIENASGLSLELRCRRPQQREDEGAMVLLKDGDNIDDSMGAFDALKFSGEVRKALLSLSVGNYVLCVRPATAEKSTVQSETPSTFEWSEDLKGVKAVRVSGIFDKLSYHIKKKLGGQLMQSSFSTIHCGLKNSNTKSKDFYFLVRTTRRKLPLTRSHASESSIVAWHEQQDILILPTIRVSNLLEVDIAVTSSDCSEKNAVEISEDRVNVVIVQGGCKTCMYADLSKLFLTVTLCNLKQKSSPVNVGDWERLSRNFKGDSHGLDVELDFGDGKRFAMMKLSRGDSGILEVIIYTPYALQNATDMKLICFMSNQKTSFLWGRKGKTTYESSPSGHQILLEPQSKICWFEKSEKVLIQRSEQNAVVSLLDLEVFSGFTEISLEVNNETGKDIVKLGVGSQLSPSSVLEPTNIICLVPRYIVVNQSNEDISVCQNGLQETRDAIMALGPGQRAMLHMKLFPGEDKAVRSVNNIFQMHRNAGPDSALCVQFSLREHGWRWSGPVCAASLGSFFLKFRRCSNIGESSAISVNTSLEKENTRFAVVDVKEEGSSLVLFFSTKSPESLPYQINNSLCNALIVFHQKESTETDYLKPGATVGYVWDDLTSAHELVVKVAGTQLRREISLDKLCPWKPFLKSRQSRGFPLSLPSGDGNIISDKLDLSKVGYEVYADGPTRILRLCEEFDSQKRRECTTRSEILYAKIDCNISYMGISLLEQVTQGFEDSNGSNCYMPIIVIRTGSLMLEFTIASKHMLCQFKVKTLEVDEKWQGAPFAAMLRVHGQDAFNREETALHMFAIVSNHASNPNQVKYSSILLKAIDLNLDEDTLMKLVPFYRTSLAESSSSREIYFESFEIQPIKIIANFLPGHPQANYTSAQETLRALLHSVIKVPTIKGATVELNGILLSHALVTFRQLALKCARHYSWYIMRAIYNAKGSQLLPPAFASLFDDSASSSLHVFFDPSKGSIDLQGFTIGMFKLLRKGDKMKGYFGTHRYIVDLERTMKTAGSNVLFAVITEVSDSVLKGVETSGFDGMVNGFRRGILKLAMEPSTLSTAFVKGNSTRRIKLDYSAGMNEIYIEGYLQAMLDTLFRQVYLKVRVVDDQVILKNLPPNSALIDEIIKCTKNFLIGEGLLASESSVAGYSLRRLQGDSEWKLGPQLKALCEQLFIVFAIRALRSQTKKMLGLGDSNSKSATGKESHNDQNKDISSVSDSHQVKESNKQEKRSPSRALTNFLMSSAVAYIDGRLCRHIPNAIVRRIVSGFLLSFVE